MTGSTGYGLAAAGYNATDQATSLTPAGGSALTQSFGGTSQGQWRTSGGNSFVTAGSLGITAIDTSSTDTTFVRDPHGALVSMRRSGQTFHYLYDGRGSVVGLTNSAGAVVNSYSYEPYGRRHVATEGVPNPFQYDAGYTLNGTIYRYGVRFYDTSNANWTQPDPLPGQPGYAYVNGDPINRTDPSGMFSIGELAGDLADGAGAVSAVAGVACLGGVGCPLAAASGAVASVAGGVETAAECGGGDDCGDAAGGLALDAVSFGFGRAGRQGWASATDLADMVANLEDDD